MAELCKFQQDALKPLSLTYFNSLLWLVLFESLVSWEFGLVWFGSELKILNGLEAEPGGDVYH